MWDPKNRPTSRQAMDHEFFADAVDPLRPKSSSRLLGRKHSDLSFRSKETSDSPGLAVKPSWFRRSLIARESAPAVPQHLPDSKVELETKSRPHVNKRATWAQTSNNVNAAPMPILPSIRPISPLPNAVNAQADKTATAQQEVRTEAHQQSAPLSDKSKKIGRQLSVNSHGNHYADTNRHDAERNLNSNSGLISPPYQRESFFSHLRKRARRFSGRHGLASPGGDDVEANAASVPWSNRSSIIVDSVIPEGQNDFFDLDKMLQSVRYSLEHQEPNLTGRPAEAKSNQSTLKRTHSVPRSQESRSSENGVIVPAPSNNRNRRTIQMNQYEAPAEEDELLDEALQSANRAARRLDQRPTDAQRNVLAQKDMNRQPLMPSNPSAQGAYMTPSPSAKRNGVQFDPHVTPAQPLNITKRPEYEHVPPHWPTPPYEENEWASAAAASIFAAGSVYR